jgi:hypothetical protein
VKEGADIGLDTLQARRASFIIAHIPFIDGDASLALELLGRAVIAAVIRSDPEAFLLKPNRNCVPYTPGPARYDCNACHEPPPPLSFFLPPAAKPAFKQYG